MNTFINDCKNCHVNTQASIHLSIFYSSIHLCTRKYANVWKSEKNNILIIFSELIKLMKKAGKKIVQCDQVANLE